MDTKDKIEYLKTIPLQEIVSAFNYYLDNIYSLMDNYNMENIVGLNNIKDEKVKTFMESLKNEAPKYEELRMKILKKDFDNLTLKEINLVGLMFLYMFSRCKAEEQKMKELSQKAENYMKNIFSANYLKSLELDK